MSKYKAAPGARFSRQQAEALGELMERFSGKLKPQELVDAARPKSSPIHSLFEWNDGKAADAFRLVQARHHINHLQIIVQVNGDGKVTKAYHSVLIEGDDDRTYASVAVVRRSVDLREQVVQQALRELERWTERYREYKSVFGGVMREAKKVIRQQRQKDLAKAGC